MALFKAPILYILLLALLSLTRLGSGNSKLVGVVCHMTDDPELCAQCLNSGAAAGADVTSKVGIATAVIGCLEGHGASLGASMSGFAYAAKEEETKRLFRECGMDYAASNADLSRAAALLARSGYDEAEKAVTVVYYRHDACQGSIGANQKVEVPAEVAYEMRLYDGLCQAADRIIERL